MSIPKYRGINSYQIPTVKAAGGASVKVIAGDFQGTKGPVKDLMVDVTYLDVHLGPTQTIEIKVRKGHTILAYVYQGEAIFDEVGNSVKERHLALLSDGAEVKVKTQKEGVDFLLVSGKPLKEPIAWAGPIVMNTQEELEVAFEELDEGTFIKGRTRGTQTET
jgi:redox-sensitive bicupin YhaK (pirin superfamily)